MSEETASFFKELSASSTDHAELMMSELTIASPVSAKKAGLAGRCPVVDRICISTIRHRTGHTSSSFLAGHMLMPGEARLSRLKINRPRPIVNPTPVTTAMRKPFHTVANTSFG